MTLRNTLTKPFQQLRWKLALSYAGVTVLALLTVEVLLIAIAGIALTVLLSSGAIPRQMIQGASVDLTPILRSYLSETPPDLRGIEDVLQRVEALTAASVPLSFNIEELLVVGSDQTLLGSSPPDLLGKNSIGQRLELDSLTALADPLQAALAGEEDLDRLYALGEPGGTVVIVAPVWDAEHVEVLGAFVGLAKIPTAMSFLSEAAPVVGVSLLFFTAVAGIAGIAYGFLAAHGPVARLSRLAEASEAWGKGDFSVVVEDPASDELGELARRLNLMANQLKQLFDVRQELAVLRERNRLARDLHDSAKQLAFAAAAQIGTVRTLIGRDSAEATTHIEEAERLIHELRQELSSLILELAPPALEDKGLATALREYSESWSRQNNIEVEMRIQGERPLPLVRPVPQALLPASLRREAALRAGAARKRRRSWPRQALRRPAHEARGRALQPRRLPLGRGRRLLLCTLPARLDLRGAGALRLRPPLGRGVVHPAGGGGEAARALVVRPALSRRRAAPPAR